MSTILGDGNPLVNFTLSSNAPPIRHWWTGFSDASIGFAVNPVFFQRSDRVVATNSAMEPQEGPPVFTVDMTAEPTTDIGFAVYRVQIGNLA